MHNNENITGSKVCLQLNCYEETYKKFFEQRLDEYLGCFSGFSFDEKIMTISNIKPASFETIDINIETKMIPLGFVKRYISDNEEEVLKSFGLNIDNYPSNSYWYSAAKFVGIFYTSCDYLLFIDDNIDMSNTDGADFINESIRLLDENENYLSSMPSWSPNDEVASAEWLVDGQKDQENFYVSYGFTDHIYLIKAKNVCRKLWNGYLHETSKRYPGYGSLSFERLVDNYMKWNLLFRMVSKKYHYVH